MRGRPELYSEVSLCRDFPAHGLRRGDVATLIEFVPGTEATGGEEGCLLEVFNAVGESLSVVAVPVSQVEPLRATEVLSVRPLAG